MPTRHHPHPAGPLLKHAVHPFFRHTSDQKPGFVEWPVDLFKEPKEPSKKCKSLALESNDGKALSAVKSLSRRSTQGSIATIATYESSAAPAFARIQERSTAKGVKGLVVEFHEAGGMIYNLPHHVLLLPNSEWNLRVALTGYRLP